MKFRSHLGIALCLIITLNPIAIRRIQAAYAAPAALIGRLGQSVMTTAVMALANLCHRSYWTAESSLVAQQLATAVHETSSVPPTHHHTVPALTPLAHDALSAASQQAATAMITHALPTQKLSIPVLWPSSWVREGLCTHSYPVIGGRTFINEQHSMYATVTCRERPIRLADTIEYQYEQQRKAQYEIQHCLRAIPGFAEQLDQETRFILDNILAINHPDLATRLYARLSIPFMHSCVPYLDCLIHNTLERLCTMFFDCHGNLISTDHHNRSIAHAQELAGLMTRFLGYQLPDFSIIPGMTQDICYDQGVWQALGNKLRHECTASNRNACVQNNNNIAMLNLIHACNNGDLVGAADLVNSDLAHTLYQHCISNALRAFYPDPYAITLINTQRDIFAQCPDQLSREIAHLAARKTLVQKICIAWHVEHILSSHHIHQQNALYDVVSGIMTSNGNNLAITMMNVIHDIAVRYNNGSINSILYLPNGILRDFGHYRIASLTTDKAILQPKYHAARKALNYCAYLHEHSVSPSIRTSLELLTTRLFSHAQLDEHIGKHHQLLNIIDSNQALKNAEDISNACARIVNAGYEFGILQEGATETGEKTEEEKVVKGKPGKKNKPAEDVSPGEDTEENDDQKVKSLAGDAPLVNSELNSANPTSEPPQDPDEKEKKKKDKDAKKQPDRPYHEGKLLYLTKEMIEEALKWVMRDKNRIDHMFDAKHILQPLLDACGGNKREVVQKILEALGGKIHFNEIFRELPVSVAGFTVYTYGRVIDGLLRLSTFHR